MLCGGGAPGLQCGQKARTYIRYMGLLDWCCVSCGRLPAGVRLASWGERCCLPAVVLGAPVVAEM